MASAIYHAHIIAIIVSIVMGMKLFLAIIVVLVAAVAAVNQEVTRVNRVADTEVTLQNVRPIPLFNELTTLKICH